MKVSVIIPAYNAEAYLVETLESVLHQSLDEYEVIVVNDGSTDGTLDILREYESNYKKMKVIDKENGGPSSARNAGLDIATGDYIFFFDSDDILEIKALKSLYKTALANEADLVIAGYDIFDNYKTTEVHDIDELLVDKDIKRYDERILYSFSLSNKLLKKEIIDRYNLRLPPISYSEDGAFLMNYVYHATKITGLNKVIFHYRRLNGEGNAITETISDAKVKDYITAHKLILQSAQESILRDFPEYKILEDVHENNQVLSSYLNRIIYKELNILIKQFYSKFWKLEDSTIEAIVTELHEKLELLDMKHLTEIANENPDILLADLSADRKEEAKKAHFTAALFGDENCSEAFIKCLNSLITQNLVGISIVIPTQMEAAVKEADLYCDNLIFEEASSENELFHRALDRAQTEYIVFCDPKVVYAGNAFKYIFKRFIRAKKDFLVELVYHMNFGDSQPVYLNQVAKDSLNSGMEITPQLCFDDILANKFFTVEFLRQCGLSKEDKLSEKVEYFYRKGCYTFFNDGIVIYDDLEENFLSDIGTDDVIKQKEMLFREKEVHLKDEDFEIEPLEAYPKLLDFEPKKFADKMMQVAIEKYTKKKIENRVLFVTIRKDGELEGNAKALYPYVTADKVVCAHMLPHSALKMIKMIKLIATSKVIVTDDYVKYLRYFPLRKEQRVVQLWHACGAFKKFGQRGTNMAIKTDLATHTQYNLVCVSGKSVRPIYSDAFYVNLKKVQALGCPRTDDFFNRELIESKKEKIYAKYPELREKSVIIYAPTFRDVGKGRSHFHPNIDFDRLSKALLPNQEFIICPHPVMKNDIIPKKYPNIRVLRDFSTNDMMFVSDMLITDYSSVIFEYALLQKPIVFYCYDLAAYNRGFYLQYPEDLPGDVYETQEELEAFLTSPDSTKLTDKYKRFLENYMSGCDGHSCERIAGIINEYMEGK